MHIFYLFKSVQLPIAPPLDVSFSVSLISMLVLVCLNYKVSTLSPSNATGVGGQTTTRIQNVRKTQPQAKGIKL